MAHPTVGDPLALGARATYEGGNLSIVVEAFGHRWRVRLPVEVAHLALDQACAAEGVSEPAQIGELPSVGGLFKRAGRLLKKATRGATRALERAGQAVAHAARTVAESKALGRVVAASALVFPAVGAAGLAAMAAARRAARTLDRATHGDRHAQAQALAMARRVPNLARSTAPAARLAVAALRSAR